MELSLKFKLEGEERSLSNQWEQLKYAHLWLPPAYAPKVNPFMSQEDLISQNSVFLSDLFGMFSAIFQQLYKKILWNPVAIVIHIIKVWLLQT